MQSPNTNTSTATFKQAFLQNLLLSLQLQTHTRKHDATSLGNAMSLHERKLGVKSSAEVAMVAACGATGVARWPQAILATGAAGACKVQRRRRIVRRCHFRKTSLKISARAGGASASTTGGVIARALVRRRTMAVREVIPGGWDAAVDEATLLCKAMDYVVHLRVQVDVLRRISEAEKI